MLIMTCVDGSASARQDGAAARWHRGQSLPLSPGLRSRLDFDGAFAQRSVRLDVERAETLCVRWLNHPLDCQLKFDLRPFSPELENAWRRAVELILTYESMGIALPPAAAGHLDEFMISLVLELHPHTYSDALRKPYSAPPPRVVREAQHLLRASGPQISVNDVAKTLGVSMRSLEKGFRDSYQATPTQYLRRLRLEAARFELMTPSEATSVTSVALANGFVHLARFSAYYRAAFDENPSQTLRRNRRKLR